jgi:hypothetical protein
VFISDPVSVNKCACAPAVLAGAANELALAVLAAPGPPQLTILGRMEQDDK